MAEEHARQEESKQNPHRDTEMREANIGAFESGGTPRYAGQPSDGPAELDPNAVQGPGGDSRPDLTDPSTAEFADVADSEMMTTTREPDVLPEAHRELAAEYDRRRSDDRTDIVARPDGPNDEEIAVLVEKAHPQRDSDNL